MYKKKLLIIGSGGHAKSCINVIESIKGVKIIGIIDNTKKRKLGKYKTIFAYVLKVLELRGH